MTNDEVIEVLKDYLDKTNLAWPRQALKKAIKAVTQTSLENSESNSRMTNAEYCIKNGIKFTDIQFQNRKESCGGGYRFRDRKAGKYIGQIGIKKTEDGRPLDGNAYFRAWLDAEHEDYKDPYEVLTGEERGYLKNLLKPFRTGSIEYIRKCGYGVVYIPSLIISSTDFGNFLIPTGNYEYTGMENDKEYKPEDLGLL